MVGKKRKLVEGKSAKWLVNFLAIYWMLFMFLDFIGNSPDYLFALSNFRYSDFLFIVTILCIAISLPFIKKPFSLSEVKIKNFRWIYFYPALLLSMLLFSFFYQSKTGNSNSSIGFLMNTLGIHLAVLFIFLSVYSTGSFILDLVSRNKFEGFRNFISIGFGIIILALFLFFAGSLGYYAKWPILGILVVMLIPGRQNLLVFLRFLIFDRQRELSLHPFSILMVLAVIILTAINFISITTAFPLGFDALTLYLNLPMLISQSGELLQGQMPYFWSLIMGIGYAVFDSNPIVQYIGIMGGLLSFLLIVSLGSKILSVNWAIFSGTFFYFIPLVIWQSSIEVKTDLGMLFFTLLAISIVFSFYQQLLQQKGLTEIRKLSIDSEEKLIWCIVGLFLGFALGIKFTAVMTMIAIICALLYLRSGFFLALAFFFGAISFLFLLDLHSFGGIELTSSDKWFLVFFLLLFSSVFLFLAIRKKDPTKSLIKLLSIYVVSSLILLVPWMGKNILEHGSISFSNLIEGSDPGPQWLSLSDETISPFDQAFPMFISEEIDDFPPVVPTRLVILEEEDIFYNTSKLEEIGRYLGYEGGAMRFLSLPYDMTMKKNVDLLSTDIGLIFLLFFPLLIFTGRSITANKWILGFSLLLVWISISIWSVYNPDNSLSLSEVVSQIQNQDFAVSSGIFSTFKDLHLLMIYPFLMLAYLLSPVYDLLSYGGDLRSFLLVIIILPLLFLIFNNAWKKMIPSSRIMAIFGVVYFVIWLFFASGIPWYGLTGLAILPLLLAKFYFSSEEALAFYSPPIRYLSFGILAFWLLMIFALRLSPHSFAKISSDDKVDYSRILAEPTLAYASGDISYDEFFIQIFNPETKKIINELNSGEAGYIINVSSMMRFFIEDNQFRVYDDNQLDFFNMIWERAGRSKVATTNRLESFGVKYILLDLDVHSMDRTPQGTLRKKVEEMVEFLHNNRHIELIATDRLVEHPSGNTQMEFNGRLIRVKNDIFGTQIIEKGKLALFKLH